MTFEELRQKARSLPLEPGVYLMHDAAGEVIYVGKAKKLRNRVSQYFQDTASHTPKTRMMVSRIADFDVIVAASEFEALVLECSLIKRHQPKYNILLKDDKGYPFVRIDLREPYPSMRMENRALEDGASYFGPFGARNTTQYLLDTLRLTYKLPGCGKKFPRDIGKERPCLNFQMGNCSGWCRPECTQAQYAGVMDQVLRVLRGDNRELVRLLREQMNAAAEAMEFERAAQLRDRLRAIEALGQKQLVTARSVADTDAVGYFQSGSRACFAVLHYVGGNLIDKDYEIVEPSESESEAFSALVKQYYLTRRFAPKTVLLPMAMEDGALFSQLLQKELGRKVQLHVPQRGDNVRLVELAMKNAREEAQRLASREEKQLGRLCLLQDMTGLEALPRRLESYDISNIAGTDMVASMVVFKDGKPFKSGYRHFKLENMDGQDDYGAMRQVLRRRFTHYQAGDRGFAERPDALLIDGGVNHAESVRQELCGMGIDIPIFGMVKDGRHRTRALVTPDGREIGISGEQAVFSLIGQIQEETHRFAITYHKKLRSKRMKRSALDDIPGIGPKRVQTLLKHFRSVERIGAASEEELRQVLPKDAAKSVHDYFQKKREEKE